jgi:hypothetical protein
LKEELIRIRLLKKAHIRVVAPVISATGIIPRKLNEILKLLDLRPALYILMQEAVILNACRIVRTFLAE